MTTDCVDGLWSPLMTTECISRSPFHMWQGCLHQESPIRHGRLPRAVATPTRTRLPARSAATLSATYSPASHSDTPPAGTPASPRAPSCWCVSCAAANSHWARALFLLGQLRCSTRWRRASLGRSGLRGTWTDWQWIGTDCPRWPLTSSLIVYLIAP